MPAPLTIRSSFWEGSDPGWTLAQVVDKYNALILVAATLSIDVNVYDDESKALLYGPVTLTIATTIYDTLQDAGGIWSLDALGCNFKAYLTNAAVFATTPAEGGKVYRAEFNIHTTTANGSGNVPVVHLLTCKPMIQT